MLAIHPQFIRDSAGEKLVVLSKKEFDALIEELEDVEDVRLYDEAMNEDNCERIPFSEYLKTRKQKNG